MSLLTLRNLTVSYRSGGQSFQAVAGVNLSIESGTTLGLVGESGSGKSTLARAIVGLVPVESGNILLRGQDVTELGKREAPRFRRTVQMVFQDPYASLDPRMRVKDVIAEGLALRKDVRKGDYYREVSSLLESVELPASAADRFPFQFSGGQRQRISIARSLAVRPDLLIADEVTSALDVSIQSSMINLLRRIQRRSGITMLFISHNLAVIRYLSDRTAVMTEGRLVEEGDTVSLFRSPQHDYTRHLIGAIPRLDGRWRDPTSLGVGNFPDHD